MFLIHYFVDGHDQEQVKAESTRYLLNKLQSPSPIGPLTLSGRRIQSGKIFLKKIL